jgi:hypothetical protein
LRCNPYQIGKRQILTVVNVWYLGISVNFLRIFLGIWLGWYIKKTPQLPVGIPWKSYNLITLIMKFMFGIG